MASFMIQAQAVTEEAYQAGFAKGYDAKADETPTVEDLSTHLMDRYTDGELEELTVRLGSFVEFNLARSKLKSKNTNFGR